MTRISVYPGDDTACGNLRLLWPAEHLASLGHDVIVNPFRQDHPLRIRVINDGEKVVDVRPIEADVVVFQRLATGRLLDTMKAIQRQGVKVIMDVDDALWAIHRHNVNHRVYNQPGNGPHWRWLLKACRQADLVTTTTPGLADKVGGVVVPNFIPERFLEVGRKKVENWEDDKVVDVGWAATQVTHPADPGVTGGEIAAAVRDAGGAARFVALGGEASRELKAFGFDAWDVIEGRAIATGPVEHGSWIEAVSTLDVSIVPLEDSEFNRGKSALKMLESAAAGCAVVASPTPDNVRIVEAGIGVLAKERKWGRKMKQALVLGAAREQAERNLELVEGHTIEGNSWRWMQAWETLA